MAHKVIDGDKLDNEMRVTADAIRQKLGVPDQLQWKDNSGFASDVDRIVIKSGGYEQGFEDGKNSVVPLEKYVTTIQIKNFNIFGKAEVELDLDSATNLSKFCFVETEDNKNDILEHLTINCPNSITNMATSFYCHYTVADTKLKRVTLNFDTKNCVDFFRTICYMHALEIVDGQPLNLSSVTNINYTRVFYNTPALKEVRFVENSIPLSFNISDTSVLSNDSVDSIIAGLKNMTGGTSQTLTLHKDVGNKLTAEQKATITAKNWTLVY